jgi:hypothetical protein
MKERGKSTEQVVRVREVSNFKNIKYEKSGEWTNPLESLMSSSVHYEQTWKPITSA